jgi:hypothetical protein
MTSAKKTKVWTAITYPQDFSDAGAGLGPQTILRLNKILQSRHEGYSIGSIVLACGLGPEVSKYPKQTRPFAEMMKEWLVAEGTFPADMIHCSADNRVWNCIEATMEMIKIIKEKNLPKNVLVVSAGFHIFPRMWATWILLCGGKKDWKLSFAPAWDGTYDLPHELGGTVKYVPMAVWYRRKI